MSFTFVTSKGNIVYNDKKPTDLLNQIKYETRTSKHKHQMHKKVTKHFMRYGSLNR